MYSLLDRFMMFTIGSAMLALTALALAFAWQVITWEPSESEGPYRTRQIERCVCR